MEKSSKSFGTYAWPVGTLIGLIVLWELAYHVVSIPEFILPRPSAILKETWEWREYLWGHTLVTAYETLLGFVLTLVIGVPLAIVLVYSPFLRRAVYPLIVITQAVPKVAIAPLLLLILGHGQTSKVVVAFLVAFFPVVVDTAAGLAATPPELLDLSRSYRAGALRTFLKVRFPMALPFFFSGVKVAITLAVVGAVVGEFVGSDSGLGYVIVSATSFWRTALTFSSMAILSVMAIALFSLVSFLERVLCPWYQDA